MRMKTITFLLTSLHSAWFDDYGREMVKSPNSSPLRVEEHFFSLTIGLEETAAILVEPAG